MGTPSFQEIGRLAGSNPAFVESVTINTTPAYSLNAYRRGQVLRVIASVDAYVKFVREHVSNGFFGDGFHEIAQNIFVDDAQGALFDPNDGWRTDLITASAPSLNKSAPIAGARDLRVSLGALTGPLRTTLNTRRRLGEGLFQPGRLPANKAMEFVIRHIETIEIVAGVNDKLDFTEGVTGAATATITAGKYTRAALATEIQTQLNAAATDNTYTVNFGGTVADKFSIVRATGTATISLNWSTGPNAATSIGTTIGFSVAADDTGATTYSADNTLAIATTGLEYQIRYTNAANVVRYWDGSIWTNTPTTIDVTGSETAALFVDAVTTEEEAVYELRLTSGEPLAENHLSFVDQIGLYEAQGDLDGAFLNAEVEYIFALPFRARVACDGSASGTLRIDDMRAY